MDEFNKKLIRITAAHIEEKKHLQSKESEIYAKLSRLLGEKEIVQRDLMSAMLSNNALQLHMKKLDNENLSRSRKYNAAVGKLQVVVSNQDLEITQLQTELNESHQLQTDVSLSYNIIQCIVVETVFIVFTP